MVNIGNIESDNEQQIDILENSLAEAISSLVKGLLNDTTNFNKSEVKSLAILTKNRFINRIIENYPKYKKQLDNNFEKSIQKAIEKFSYAIANKQKEIEPDNNRLLQFFRKR